MGKVSSILLDEETLEVWEVLLDCRVPQKRLAAEVPIFVVLVDLVLYTKVRLN